ncbi:peptidoglycan DD-metalloendopeptidase family protein [Altererythrobacter sp. Root672]|uniref:peptidoglycan DD-metalloendopeptidase family protein n=1 Tax=Altererythrobacter sp. Root672 TaxID=1736584 RepID=UPI001F275A25|nr:peptidoglycan DD-metalloendopeptidase family protein [Altererythrobacter sp. Root672]
MRGWFPEREFFMRSQGQVRFITITSRMQMIAAGLAVAVVGGWGLSVGVMAISQYQAVSERLSLLEREARVATSESRVKAYQDDVNEVASDVGRRMDFIEKVLPMLPDDVVAEDTVSDSTDEAAKTVEKVSALMPEAASIARIEARQLALVERLTRFADRRAARAEAAIRELGLDPRTMLTASRTAQGGPLQKLSTESDGSLDPRFQRLGLSLARMDALEQGLTGIPQVMPADMNMISSGFGYRSDPFTGGAALHAGLDFRGHIGAPIHAAAKGRVSFVGIKSGYGKVIEVSHGNGLMTRYAHMSAWRARVGQEVEAGDVIGAIGSTGRSTGPHLHFEVRINGRAVNPRPFLETAPHVLEEARTDTPERGTTKSGAARG